MGRLTLKSAEAKTRSTAWGRLRQVGVREWHLTEAFSIGYEVILTFHPPVAPETRVNANSRQSSTGLGIDHRQAQIAFGSG